MCYHGGGALVLPLIQEHAYISLDPIVVEIPPERWLSLDNVRVKLGATCIVGVTTDPEGMYTAAERLLNLSAEQISDICLSIIRVQLRQTIAKLSTEEMVKEREKLPELLNKNIAEKLSTIGIELINTEIGDPTDDNGNTLPA